MSYYSDKRKFEKKYGKKAVANSIRIRGTIIEKVWKQPLWKLLLSTRGKTKSFNDGVRTLEAVMVRDGYVPQFNYLLSLNKLKFLREDVERAIRNQEKRVKKDA